MNICYVNAFFHPYIGGSEKHLYELTKRVARRHNVHVLTSQLKGTKREEVQNKVKIHRLPTRFVKAPLIYPPPLVFTKGVVERLAKLDKKEDFDIINCHGRWFPDFAKTVFYANEHKKLFIQTIHNAKPTGISPMVSLFGVTFENLYGKKILRNADYLITVSKAVKRDMMDYGVPADRIYPIHNGVDTKTFKPAKPTYREELADGFDNVLLFVGRIIEQKGLTYAIDGMKEIVKEYPSTRLLIVGKGKLKEKLQQKVKKERLEKHVTFPGFIPEERLCEMYSSPDIFLLPSLWEVFPISMLEALACGAPLLSSDAGGNAEMCEHGDNGFVFHMKDTPKMVEYALTMLDDPKLRKKMGKRSRERAVKEFDWEIITKRTLQFYRRICNDFYRNPNTKRK